MPLPSRKNRAMTTPPIQKASQATYVQTAVRIPRSLHTDLQDAAERNGRSMNAEIIARLSAAGIDEKIEKLGREIAELKAINREILHSVSEK